MRLFPTLVCLGLMAGTAHAAPQWYTTVELSEAADIAVLEDDGTPGDNVFRIRSTNGTFAPRDFQLPEGELIIQMLGGNDRLTFDASILPTLTATVTIYGGDGRDITSICNLNTSGSVVSADSGGSNALKIKGSGIAGNVLVYDGVRSQTVSIKDSIIDGDVDVQSWDGGSRVALVRTDVGGSVFVNNSGFGDDRLTFANSSTGGDYYAEVGSGATYCRFSGIVSGSTSILIDGGLLEFVSKRFNVGDSLFTFCGEGETFKSLTDTVLGGGIFSEAFLGYDQTCLTNVEASEFQLNNGEGGSLLEIKGTFNADRLVTVSGQGDDEVDIHGTGFLPTVDINSGDGNSRLEVSGDVTLGNVVHSSGGGFDIVKFFDTIIQGSLISFNFGGGSDVRLDGVSVGETVDVESLDGTDFFRIFDSEFNGPVFMRTNNGTDTFTVSASQFFNDFVIEGGFDFDIFETSNDSFFAGLVYTPDFEFFLDF